MPIAKFLGFDPIWFSIIFLLNMGSPGSIYAGHMESRPALCGDSDIGPGPDHAIPVHSPMAAGKNVLKPLLINTIHLSKVYHDLDILRV
jgi:hypothetical protein